MGKLFRNATHPECNHGETTRHSFEACHGERIVPYRGAAENICAPQHLREFFSRAIACELCIVRAHFLELTHVPSMPAIAKGRTAHNGATRRNALLLEDAH